MSTIGSTNPFTTLSHFNISKQSAAELRSGRGETQENAPAPWVQSEPLAELYADLKELKQQANLTPKDYLLSSLTLKEKISSERLSAGEKLDVFGVHFEGRDFKLAGRLYGPGTLKPVQDSVNGLSDKLDPKATLDIRS